MVVGVVVDNEGRPIMSELWPGNTADVKSLVPVVDRLRTYFKVNDLCIVADRGMISQATFGDIKQRGWKYILGVRMRRFKEANETVLARAGRYEEVYPKSDDPKAAAPLKVKEVWVEDRRYVVCLNEDQATKDRHDREAIVASLQAALKAGDKQLIGNRGYRKYVQTTGRRFALDEDKIQAEARFDGKWVLTTNTDLSAREHESTQQLTRRGRFRFSASKLLLREPRKDGRFAGYAPCSVFCLDAATLLHRFKGACSHSVSVTAETNYSTARGTLPPTLRQSVRWKAGYFSCPRISPPGCAALWTLMYRLPALKLAICASVSLAPAGTL